MRLIDADELYKAFENVAWYDNADRDDVSEELLFNAPTIDAAPVANGKWRYCGSDRFNDAFECSVCGRIAMNDSDFCPNCGAKMDGGEEE